MAKRNSFTAFDFAEQKFKTFESNNNGQIRMVDDGPPPVNQAIRVDDEPPPVNQAIRAQDRIRHEVKVHKEKMAEVVKDYQQGIKTEREMENEIQEVQEKLAWVVRNYYQEVKTEEGEMKVQDEDKDMKTFHAVDTDGEYQEMVDQTQPDDTVYQCSPVPNLDDGRLDIKEEIDFTESERRLIKEFKFKKAKDSDKGPFRMPDVNVIKNESGNGYRFLSKTEVDRLCSDDNEFNEDKPVVHDGDQAVYETVEEEEEERELGEFRDPSPYKSTEGTKTVGNIDAVLSEELEEYESVDIVERVVQKYESIQHDKMFRENVSEVKSAKNPVKNNNITHLLNPKEKVKRKRQVYPKGDYAMILCGVGRCPWTFKDDHSADIHRKILHEETDFSCLQKGCDRTFSLERGLTNHLKKTHHIAMPFHCMEEGCTKAYAQKKHLISHGLHHTQHKPYACEDCGRKFKQKCEVQNHQKRAHSNEKPFACGQCGYACKSNDDVKKHIASVHVMLRPFACKECGSKFKRPAHLHSHMKVVHSDSKPFQCGKCEFSCKVKWNLKVHEKKHELLDKDLERVNANGPAKNLKIDEEQRPQENSSFQNLLDSWRKSVFSSVGEDMSDVISEYNDEPPSEIADSMMEESDFSQLQKNSLPLDSLPVQKPDFKNPWSNV